jgi:hypothetical protein
MSDHCEIHTDVKLVCPSCLAAKGGAATKGLTSKAKAKSSANNGRLYGGRPKLPKHSVRIHGKGDRRFKITFSDCRGCIARKRVAIEK